MTAKRFFYRRPLPAAYMAETFEMKMVLPPLPGETHEWTLNPLIIAFQMDSPV